MDNQTEYSVEMRDICKSFGGVRALRDVSLSVRRGEIHALVGQNGAGKSTLVKILSGAYPKDSGEIYVNGKLFQSNNIVESHRNGIGIIYQEFALCPDLSVMENIFINRLTLGRRFVNRDLMKKEAQIIINRLGFDIDPGALLGTLTVAYQQIVEIAKTLSQDVDVLVLDEPTAVLSPYETEQLFTVLQNLKSQGTTIIYISHRLPEIFRLSDRITIMRDGKIVDTVNTSETDMDSIITAMIGQNLNEMFPKLNENLGGTVLSVKDICNGDRAKSISFDVRSGEILGIAGLIGAGKTEAMRAIFGADDEISGEVYIEGKLKHIKKPSDAIAAGIGYLPESRKEDGVILENSIRINTTIAGLKKVTNKIGALRKKQETDDVQRLIDLLATKTSGIECNVEDLSGGNQQKVSLSKWLFVGNKVIILDEPTRGVDVGAKAEIYNIINDLAGEGIAFVVISSEIEEIIGLSHRIIVLNKGQISGELTNRETFTQENVLNLSIGREAIA
jgi:ribose transport system ATP-binding protein